MHSRQTGRNLTDHLPYLLPSSWESGKRGLPDTGIGELRE